MEYSLTYGYDRASNVLLLFLLLCKHIVTSVYPLYWFYIDYKLLLKTINDLKIIELYLLKGTNQIAVHCREETALNAQLSEGCNSLFFDWDAYDSKIHSKVPKRNEQLKEIDFNKICDLFKNTYMGILQPIKWYSGFSTWNMKEETLKIVESWDATPAPWILHRGNNNGLSPETENDPKVLLERLKEGWDIEIDLWKINNELYLGHDAPTYKITDDMFKMDLY